MSNRKNNPDIITAIVCLNSAVANMRLYNDDHPQVARYLKQAFSELKQALRQRAELTVILLDDELIVDQQPLPGGAPQVSQFAHLLKKSGIERITFSAAITAPELSQLAGDLTSAQSPAIRSTPGITLGKVVAEKEQPESGQSALEWSDTLAKSREQLGTLFDGIKRFKRLDIGGFETLVANVVGQMAGYADPLQMLAVLKNWDEYTFTHAINVCLLTMAQAEALGVSGQKLHDIGIAAALHDAGKLFVPDEILNKSGKLSEEEWRQMRIHAIRGAMQVLRMEGLPKLAFIGALEHHIRYDGTGYPLLGGYRPSLVSQMIAIADTFDAMRSRRPYQEPKPIETIIGVLKNDSGTAFNPQLVENFLNIITRGRNSSATARPAQPRG